MNEHASESSGKNDLNKNLIKRFNFHSTMILKSTLGADVNHDTSTSNRMETEETNEETDEDNVAKKVMIRCRIDCFVFSHIV